jgi:hypothetical protein
VGDNGVAYIHAFRRGPEARGHLRWFADQLDDHPRPVADGGVVVSEDDWRQRKHPFAGEGGVLYVVEPNGNLVRHIHLGIRNGTREWAPPVTVAGGFNQFSKLFAGKGKVIYAVRANDGTLWMCRDRGASLSDWTHIGDGWGGFAHVFAGEDDVIYRVAEGGSGQLEWCRHTGVEDDEYRWEGPQIVSDSMAVPGGGTRSWLQFDRLFAPTPSPLVGGERGRIYVVTRDGELCRTRHIGWASGSRDIEPFVTVATGWNMYFQCIAARM